MAYVVLGAASFAVAAVFDLAMLRGWRHLKQALGLAVLLLLGYATYGLIRTSPRFRLPAPLVWLGWPLLVIAAFLLVYSVLIEIPFRQTYTQGRREGLLITSGTYALCRHPGVLWFGLLLVALTLVSRARLLLIAGPVWLLMDAVNTWIEDCYYFPRMFPEYRQYQRQVPILVPTRKSIVRCLRTSISGEVSQQPVNESSPAPSQPSRPQHTSQNRRKVIW